jgi:pimeloyl-ACP methyl ester carboxylesterase
MTTLVVVRRRASVPPTIGDHDSSPLCPFGNLRARHCGDIDPTSRSVGTGAGKPILDLGELRLHYLDFGGEGLPVVFLHSKPWDAWSYDGFAQRFASEYRVLAPTLRGSGDSEGSPADVETDGEDILRFMDVLGIERAVLVGNSTPGLAMAYLAEYHSERIAGLVFLAPGLPLGDFAGADSLRI